MPTSFEVHLGFTFPQFEMAERALGIKIDLDDEDDEMDGEYFKFSSAKKQIEAMNKVNRAWRKSLTDAGLKIAGQDPEEDDDSSRLLVKTPDGNRTMGSFTLELNYDPNEIGHEPEDATIGISLSSRYFPTFLDYKDPHGTLTVLDLDLLQIARNNIEAEFPIFKQANVLIVEKFY